MEGKNYKIGDKGPAGGWIFYDKGNNSDGWCYLEAAPEDQGIEAEWGRYGQSIPDAKGTAVGTGKSNTHAILSSCNEANIATRLATAYQGGVKSDWFLPSKDELNLMYENLHKAGIGGFANDSSGLYWSSSEKSAEEACSQSFPSGIQYDGSKDLTGRVRAVRAF